ncbi:MAG: arginine deiminase-related protein [Brumimicrobium sp.]
MQQITNTILMIRPASFRANEETISTNFFQKSEGGTASINQKAQIEFDDFVSVLRKIGVQVIVVEDDPENDTPDALFPNNWVSFHTDGTVGLYPMFAENRRRERRQEIIDQLIQMGFEVNKIIDYSYFENQHLFLEGTGSLILDRTNKKAYCALSSRSSEEPLITFCKDFDFMPVAFKANQSVENIRKPIYHTNVLLTIGETFAVVCLDSIDDVDQQTLIVNSLQKDGKEIIPISEAQLNSFAGNMLQVRGANDKRYLVMSEQAKQSLSNNQLGKIEEHASIISSPLTTIETHGGGSARCMMAEVFLPLNKQF